MKVIATYMPRFTATLWRRQAEAAKLDAAIREQEQEDERIEQMKLNV
jgi:hypothetical protein